MGIKGLLHALQPATIVAPISQFKGQRVAIDASGWLHKVRDNNQQSTTPIATPIFSLVSRTHFLPLFTLTLSHTTQFCLSYTGTEFVCCGGRFHRFEF